MCSDDLLTNHVPQRVENADPSIDSLAKALTVLSVLGFTIPSFEHKFECLPDRRSFAKPSSRQDRGQAVAGLAPLARTLAGSSGSRPPLFRQLAHGSGGAERSPADPCSRI